MTLGLIAFVRYSAGFTAVSCLTLLTLSGGCTTSDDVGSTSPIDSHGPLDDALELAWDYGYTDSLEEHLEDGVDPDSEYAGSGQSALFAAARTHNIDVTEMLIAYGATVDWHDGENWTPLFGVATNGSSEQAQILIDNGADQCRTTSFDDYDGMTPLDVARHRQNEEMVTFLEQLPPC
jgi:ankyrin repeat protein